MALARWIMAATAVLMAGASPGFAEAPPEPRLAESANDPATWVLPDDYPKEALFANLSGNVEFELAVDQSGRAASCKVLKSSGSPALDNKTCEAVSQRARFKPATGSVPSTYRNSVRWVHPGWPEIVFNLIVRKDGGVESCEVERQDVEFPAISDVCSELKAGPFAEGLEQRMQFRLSLRIEAKPLD